MSTSRQRLKLFAANANPKLAEEIAEYLGVTLGASQVKNFSDGETRVQINESVRGADVFVIQPTCNPVNDNLMELLIMIDALRRASARRISAVIPYYGYARQERKARARDPISAKLVANLLTAAGARRVLTMDLHASAIQGFFDIPVDHLRGVPILAEYYLKRNLKNVVVVSPDLGGVTRARDLAQRLGSDDIAILDKIRPKANVAEIMNIIGNVEGKSVVMVDDIIDTAGTITQGAQVLADRGAKEVFVCCTHPVLSGQAMARLQDSVIKEVVVTNTIPIPEERIAPKIKILSVAPLLGEAIIRIHEDLPLSKLFN